MSSNKMKLFGAFITVLGLGITCAKSWMADKELDEKIETKYYELEKKRKGES